MIDTSFKALREAPLHALTPEDWAVWYPAMASFLADGDAAVRAAALERLMMAVFRGEKRYGTDDEARDAANAVARASWLLRTVEAAGDHHPDLLPAFLTGLRWHGDDEPYPSVLLPWLERLLGGGPPAPEDLVLGAVMLVGGPARASRERLEPLLDHADEYVRGCAANMLGRAGLAFDPAAGPDADAMDPGFLDRLTAKELARPGLVGPFWSGCDFFGDYGSLGRDPVEWMLTIVERRDGPEPDGMAFNGVDFHIHELAAHSPDAVRRLLAAGRADLALMTATEIRDRVDGMAPLLHDMAGDTREAFAAAARIHLAAYYGEAAPGADPSWLRHVPGWRPGLDAFVIRHGDAKGFVDRLVLFPRGRTALPDEEAWSVLDAVLAPELRGPQVRHPLVFDEDGPAPLRLGGDEIRAYASGAEITLTGGPDTRTWRRLDILGRGLQAVWHPFEAMA